ncbi:MAG: hypothetical protein V3T17_19920 [Pseudomonadales bacterium]
MDIDRQTQQYTLSWITLVVSSGTLLCCALPILLVSLGFGVAVASLTHSWPILITLAEYELWMFTVSAVLLGTTAWVLWFRIPQCPSDPVLAERCTQARKWSRGIFFAATIMWMVGFISAFLLLPIRNFIGI